MKQSKKMLRRWARKAVVGIVSGSLCMIAPGLASAEERSQDQYSFDQIVVTATKNPEKEFEANANISVITREEIDKKHYSDVSEALKHVQGVTLLNYGQGETYSSGGVYINGSANVVFLIDGVRAATNGGMKVPAGEFVNMDMIERIEVLKGSASTLYGSDAQGGVINIITRKPKAGQAQSTLGVGFGSYGKQQYNFTNSGTAQIGFYWTVGAQKRVMNDYTDGNGNSVINYIDSTALNFKIGKQFDKNSELSFSYQKYQSDYQIPDSGTFSKTRVYGKKDNHNLRLEYNRKMSEKLTGKFSLYENRSILNYDIFRPTLWHMDLETIGFSGQLSYKAGDHTLTGGYDYYQDTVRDYYNAYYAGSTLNVESYQNQSLTNQAVFIQDEWKMGKYWNLTPGVRFDRHSQFGSHTTPSIVLGYKPNDKTNYYISYKEFFIAPGQYQVFAKIGSKDLLPEQGRTYEFGVNHKFDKTFVGSFNIYQQHADNMIGYRYLTSAPWYQYYNTGVEDSHGWGLRLEKELSKHFNANVGYTYIYVNPSSATSNPNRNGFLPRGTWNIGLNYKNGNFDAGIDGRGIVDRQGAYGGKFFNVYHNFWVWNLAMNYKISPSAKVYAKINNVFDLNYAEAGSGTQTMTVNWYSQPGRNFEVGVTYAF
jgi:vitamin B12 transporter